MADKMAKNYLSNELCHMQFSQEIENRGRQREDKTTEDKWPKNK